MDRKGLKKGLPSFASRFLREVDGVMTILTLFFFVILVGIGALAIDIGRVYGLRGQMVSYVDQVALASAAELDGQTGAIQRAYRVALGGAAGPLVSTSYNFASGGGTLDIYNLIFLKNLDAGPGPTPTANEAANYVVCSYQAGVWTPANCNDPTSSSSADKTAKFVAVASTPMTVAYFVLPIANFFLGPNAIANSATLKMQATAGFKRITCDITPLMICNPSEPLNNTDTRYPFTPVVGQQILMKASGTGAAWSPGDFGLLDQPSNAGGVGCKGSGTSFLECMLGLVNPITQCVEDKVSVRPGQAQATSDGINTRFDIYIQSANKYSGNALFAPSANVTKGIVGQSKNACPNNYQPATTSVPLPRDANIKADTGGNTRFGNGVSYADIQNYWATNHPGVAMPASIQTACQTSGNACRYTVYRYEIDNNLVPNIKNGENGNAVCTTPGVNNPARDRRMLMMAVINCNATGLHGNTSNSGTYTGIPVTSYVKMFMTEPMGLQEDATGKVTGFSNSSNNLYGEVLGTVKPSDQSGVLHVVPVLYR